MLFLSLTLLKQEKMLLLSVPWIGSKAFPTTQLAQQAGHHTLQSILQLSKGLVLRSQFPHSDFLEAQPEEVMKER